MANCKSREGAILSVGPDWLLVRVDEEEFGEGDGCRSCAMRGMCHGRAARGTEVKVPVPDAAKWQPGERVRLRYRQANPALAAVVMFLPALLGLLLGGFAANGLFGAGDGIFLAGSAGGLVLGLLITVAVNRLFPSLGPKAELIGEAGAGSAPVVDPT